MKAKAPGKVVISGAYSVLEGAPAIVAAVDRYVVAASYPAGTLLTEEVKAAGLATPYWFDATALRQNGLKLGLGSSAAILAASLAVDELVRCPELSDSALVGRVYPLAVHAHRVAQGGGSGIDVAATCFGGILNFQLFDNVASFQPLSRPMPLHVEVWASKTSVSTAQMLAATRSFKENDSAGYCRAIGAQAAAAEATSSAWQRQDWVEVVRCIAAQRHALDRLGTEAGVPIVTPEVRALADLAEKHAAAVLPAGAGGGDIAVFVGTEPPHFLAEAITRWGHSKLSLELGARGLHADND